MPSLGGFELVSYTATIFLDWLNHSGLVVCFGLLLFTSMFGARGHSSGRLGCWHLWMEGGGQDLIGGTPGMPDQLIERNPQQSGPTYKREC